MQRPLSVFERALWLASRKSPINFALTARIEENLTEDLVRAALRRLAPARPLMAARIVGQDSNACFVFDGRIEFPIRALEAAADRDWVNLTREELLTPFDRTVEPAVRLTLLKGDSWTDLVVCCDHGASDGLSAAYLVRDLLRLAADPEARVEAASKMPPALPHSAPAAVQRRLRFRLSLLRAASAVGWPVLRWAARLRRPAPPRPPDSETFRLMAWALDTQRTAALSDRARRESTTVHAALCAAFLLAFAEGEPTKKRRVSCPVNLRERMSATVGEQFGLFVSIAEAPLDCRSDKDFWEIARNGRQQLLHASDDPKLWLPVLAGEQIFAGRDDAELLRVIEATEPSKVRYDLSITNLGRLEFPSPEGRFPVRWVHGPAVSALPGECILGVSTAGGRMAFVFTFRDHILNPERAHRLRDRAMAILESAV